jgi:hypothetical protein
LLPWIAGAARVLRALADEIEDLVDGSPSRDAGR